MIRTDTVTLTTIQAIAYRQKLPAGGSGIVVLSKDCAQPGIASISKTSGDPILSANTPKDKYPVEIFREAIELTAGLPYKKRGAPSAASAFAALKEPAETPEEKKLEEELEVVVDSAEYKKVVDAYTDKKGKLSYALLNKDLIRFIHSSSVARSMIEKKASVSEITLYAAGSKFRGITGNHKLSDDQVKKMIELLDEVSPKGVLKEFTEELRKGLKK